MKNLIGMFTSVLSILSFAIGASEQVTERKITKINLYDTYAVLWLDEPFQNTDECTKSSANQVVLIDVTDATNGNFYSTALAARISGEKVGFGLSGCQGWGDGTIPKAYRVDL